jgi:hypothetical protein
MSTYNGWTNYETWLVNLWLDNDQGTQEAIREMAQDCRDNPPSGFSHDPNAAVPFALRERIKDYVEELVGEHEGLVADLIGAALAEVNYSEIAEHYLSDLD